jgi:hypothetical protein
LNLQCDFRLDTSWLIIIVEDIFYFWWEISCTVSKYLVSSCKRCFDFWSEISCTVGKYLVSYCDNAIDIWSGIYCAHLIDIDMWVCLTYVFLNIKCRHFQNEHKRFFSLVIIMRDIIHLCISLFYMSENVCTGLQYFDLHFGVSTVMAYNQIFAKCARILWCIPPVLIPVQTAGISLLS